MSENDPNIDPNANPGQDPNPGGSDIDKDRVPGLPFEVPEKYKDEVWAKNLKSVDGLFDQFANAQKLVGSSHRPPESQDQYELPEAERSEEQEKNLRELLFNAGLSKKQASTLLNNYGKLVETYQAKAEADSKAKAEQADQDFDKMMAERYGNKWQQVVAQGKIFLDKHMADHSEVIQGMSNAQLGVMAEALNKFNTEFKKVTGVDSTFANLDPGGSQQDIENLKEEIANLRSDKDYYADADFNPRAKYLKDRVYQLTDALQKAQKAGK